MYTNQENQKLKVSVVLPVYNGEKFITESVNSILNQTYKNFELIIVDDKSTDSTPNIIKSFAEKDKRVHVLTNKKNLKLPSSLNRGFSFAKGDLYTWTSDDNLYKRNAFEEMVKFLECHPDSDFVYAGVEYIDEYSKYIGSADYINGDLSELPLSNCIGACFMYRNIVHKKLKGYNKQKFLVEDYDFWLRTYKNFNMGFISKILYEYRNHGNSLTATRMQEIQAGRIGLYKDELKWNCFSLDINIRICKEIADYYYKLDKYVEFRRYMKILKGYSLNEYEKYKLYFNPNKLISPLRHLFEKYCYLDKRKFWIVCEKLGISSFNDKLPISKLLKKISKYDVVSFDIFDTLIFRTVHKPSDVFGLVEKEINSFNYKKMRIDAENDARKIALGMEPNISEIYAQLKIENYEKVLATELNIEQQVCICNPYMMDVMNTLVQNGKEVIIVSDMYLSSSFLKAMLERCGYRGKYKVFVSNEYRASKYNGELYKILLRDNLKGKKVIHIGDNRHSDYLMALKNGWQALLYKKK